MRFSIIIPVFNVEEYLEQCVLSVLSQTYQDFEIILINDGSTDQSAIMCEQYETQDKRIQVIHKINEGLSSARNKGLELAMGDYILFIDSDDFWKHNRVLEDINNILLNNDFDLILFGFSYYYSDHRHKDIHFEIDDLSNNFVLDLEKLVTCNIYFASAWNKCIKKNLLIDNQLFFPFMRLSEDIIWCARLAMYVKKYTIFNDVVYMYRQKRKGSITYQVSEKNILDIFQSIEEGCDLAKNIANVNKEIEEAVLVYFSRYYLEVLPYIGFLFFQNNQIKAYVNEYRFLVHYAKNLNIKSKKIVYILVYFLGMNLSIFILFFLVKILRYFRLKISY